MFPMKLGPEQVTDATEQQVSADRPMLVGLEVVQPSSIMLSSNIRSFFHRLNATRSRVSTGVSWPALLIKYLNSVQFITLWAASR